MKRFRLKSVRYVVRLYNGWYAGRISNSSGTRPFSVLGDVRFAARYNLVSASLALAFVQSCCFRKASIRRVVKNQYGYYAEAAE